MTKTRAIIRINDELCTGCGICLPSCVEGALHIEKGKLRLIADKMCDGLGACLASCPHGALSIEEREAAPFEEPENMPHCPSAAVATEEKKPPLQAAAEEKNAPAPVPSQGHWPVKLNLVPPAAPFLKSADILLTADCAPAACPDFHRRYAGEKTLLICCPKFEDRRALVEKLTAIIRDAAPASFTLLRMEVPCCGMPELLAQAQKMAGSSIPVRVKVLDRFGKEQEFRTGTLLSSLG